MVRQTLGVERRTLSIGESYIRKLSIGKFHTDKTQEMLGILIVNLGDEDIVNLKG